MSSLQKTERTKRQSPLFLSVKDLQGDIQSHSTSFATAVKDIEGFLEENQTKLSPQELTALREKLHQAKEQYEVLQERTRVAQKELEEAVTSALQQETEKVAGLLLVFQRHIGAVFRVTEEVFRSQSFHSQKISRSSGQEWFVKSVFYQKQN
jgi:hypothetical protein